MEPYTSFNTYQTHTYPVSTIPKSDRFKSKPKFIPKIKIDGISFEGGGTRALTHDYAMLLVLVNYLKRNIKDILVPTKYYGSNSGGSWTLASLVGYEASGITFPLDNVVDPFTFYNQYWLTPVEANFV